MPVQSKEVKLLTLSLLLRTMPKQEQSLLMSHFTPDVVKELNRIQGETGAQEVEKLDWTPFYRTWPELQRILEDCKEEMKVQKLVNFAEEQRPRLRDYILSKLGKQKKGPPVILPEGIADVIDDFLANEGII